MSQQNAPLDSLYTLDDKYTRQEGRVYISGIQALVRLPLMQRHRDVANGLRTAGFISGYRGSPLGGYDLALWQTKALLEENHIRFEPGVNEDLAATAVWGSQTVQGMPNPRYDGVFGIWYGKGPGVDRSCDALKHGNYQGSSEHGGVLALCGDDPGAKSSSLQHQSEPALVHMGIPILNPANVQDYLDLGLYGFAMSRFSGCWVGFKCLTDTVESAASVAVGAERVQLKFPEDARPAANLRSGHFLTSESALYHHRLPAAQAFVRANGLDRVTLDSPSRRLGIVTTGKAYLDVRQALEGLGLDESGCAALGISVYKVALAWPLEPEGARSLTRGLQHVLVVEEKRGLIEDQLAAMLYNQSERPSLEGNRSLDGSALVPDTGELSPSAVQGALRRWLLTRVPESASRLRSEPERPPISVSGGVAPTRMAGFCSGCPHNTSTRVPEDAMAGGGIGCHGMASSMPSRNIRMFTHMGGEGANWVGASPFTETDHVFQNIGDGTYFHSGLLAIRANVAAGTHITYKVLNNGAVAMTGGQPIEGGSIDGEISTPQIVAQLLAEGANRVAVLSDHPEKYARGSFPTGVRVHDRDKLMQVQKELREVPGVTALVYDQTCAAEARRMRRRGELPEPDRRIVINEQVCEGCGDCSVQSNCISIEPVETEFGRKRRINQSSCNKDYSCVAGYCPSFVSVVGGTLKKTGTAPADSGEGDPFRDLPLPELPDAEAPYNVLVTGIGGTGVVTVGALLGMAAHLEARACSVLDVTGLAQKNGPVTSHVRIGARTEDIHATRIATGAADLIIGCDIVVAANPENLAKLGQGRTTPIVNRHVAPTSEFANNPDLDLSSRSMEAAIQAGAGAERCSFVDATRLTRALLGDAIFTNPFLMGYAFQSGRLPVSLQAIERAIELNARSVDLNKRAFAWGRLAAHDLSAVETAAGVGSESRSDSQPREMGVAEIVAQRTRFLGEYQNASYARRYRALVDRAAERERAACGESEKLTEAVAHYYAKVLAYKDEYEVARLFSDGSFRRQLQAEFEGPYQLQWHAAPPHLPVIDLLMNRLDPETGRTRKITLGAWMFQVLGILARFKFLRGTAFDPFGRHAHRRLERQQIIDYEVLCEELFDGLQADNLDIAVELASLPEHVRGFDSVKEEQLAAVQDKRNELLNAFRRSAPASPAN